MYQRRQMCADMLDRSVGFHWKEVEIGVQNLMDFYCGDIRSEAMLRRGLERLEDAKVAPMKAENPHELGRLMECHSLISLGELVIKSSLSRKASNSILDFYRLDYPEMDPPEWDKLLPIRQVEGRAEVRELPLDFHLREPYAPDYEENYRKHAAL